MIDRYRAQVTVAPNFAYELVARRVSDDDLGRLDLSSLRVALNGAEPIRARTLDAVIDRLGAAGFRADAFVLCYGMAEVDPARHGERGRTSLRATSTSTPRPWSAGEAVPAAADGAARLVAQRCAGRPGRLDRRPGDPPVAAGRHRRRDLAAGRQRHPRATGGGKRRPRRRSARAPTRATARSCAPATSVCCHDGDLFVTGRLKDLLIVNGRNIYPQDIEEVVRLVHPALTDSPGVVLVVDAGQEYVVVIQGVRESALGDATPAELTAEIKGTVARTFEVAAPSVVLVERRGVHRTTSGKVQRRSMHASFLDGTIEGVLHEDIDPAVRSLRTGGE